MVREHGIVWGYLQTAAGISHQREGEAILTSLKIQVYKIESFTKNVESEVRASINRIRDLTYTLIQLRQRI